MPVNDNDPGNVIRLEKTSEVLICPDCECPEFYMVRSKDIIYIFCAECDEQY